MTTGETGHDAETLACDFLRARGLALVERNYRSRYGEIDLIMDNRDCLIFVEVRYRRQARYGSGAESVGPRERARLIACARYYLMRHPRAAQRACRFDVVAIGGGGEEPAIEWIADAFPAWQ
jgi:putative endonuclease